MKDFEEKSLYHCKQKTFFLAITRGWYFYYLSTQSQRSEGITSVSQLETSEYFLDVLIKRHTKGILSI